MSHHIEDGRVWAVDDRTGEKRRVLPHILKHSKRLSLAPSERAKNGEAKQQRRVTEPRQPRTRRARRVAEPEQPEPDTQPATEPAAQESEPDSQTQPATEPGETSEKES